VQFAAMPGEFNEKELLQQVALGNEIAFRTLYNHYRSKVLTIAGKLLSAETEVLDVLQEVFVKIWVHRHKLPEVDNFNAYLNTITRNHLYNILRRQAYEQAMLDELAAPAGNAAITQQDALDIKALKQLLLKSIQSLPPQQQRVFELSKLEGLKQEEIAALLQISRETVKKHLAEAMRNLRAALGNNPHAMALLLVLSFAG
jgi:RNA polymerase sigma-70 factor (family 1)